MRGACECEAWALVHVNLDGTTRAVVKAPWTSPRVATEVATVVVPMAAVVKAPWTSPRVATEVAITVVPMVEARGDDAAPLLVAFCLMDLRSPIS
ncbi:hypothetical protein ACFXTH_045688 [Malus domestica]